ncbi:IS200/IS605 family transposase [Paenibacillus popilliae]|uniref:Transposase and inactivated derivative n=1 Tax=Paenibacillus popilliae ATCC 14706 TaxID=1212764 RepID=M9LPP2_PAEPP|nr:IS200/IS605 family transposase [Paenibacillus popilliae]GAC42561.1 transposase and inactivated derivative [Paenibacillus popilliae ATCC 14706]
MAEIKHGRGYVYSIQYHIVWCVKYRNKVLLGDIDIRVKEILNQIATDNGFTISKIESDCDHVHLFIDCNPQHSIPNMIKALKGVSARLLFKEFPQLKKKLLVGNLWNPSYFVATASEHTEAQIRQYIQNQKVR